MKHALVFAEKEILFIRTMAYCGCSSGKMLDPNTLKKFVKYGLAYPTKYQAGKHEKIDYKPTEKLKKMVKEIRRTEPRLDVKFVYKSTSDYHDLKLEKHGKLLS